MSEDRNFQPTADMLMGTEDQVGVGGPRSAQSIRRAALAYQRITQELADAKAQGAHLDDEQLGDIASLLEDMADARTAAESGEEQQLVPDETPKSKATTRTSSGGKGSSD